MAFLSCGPCPFYGRVFGFQSCHGVAELIGIKLCLFLEKKNLCFFTDLLLLYLIF